MLTPKQEKFVQGLIKGLSQRQAYIQAGYSTKNMSDNSIDREASVLFKSPKVSQRYRELMNEHKEKALWTREDSVNTLKWLVKQSIESINRQDDGYIRQSTSNAIVNAIKELNELELLYPMQQKQAAKIDKELATDTEGQDEKIASYIELIKGKMND